MMTGSEAMVFKEKVISIRSAVIASISMSIHTVTVTELIHSLALRKHQRQSKSFETLKYVLRRGLA